MQFAAVIPDDSTEVDGVIKAVACVIPRQDASTMMKKLSNIIPLHIYNVCTSLIHQINFDFDILQSIPLH